MPKKHTGFDADISPAFLYGPERQKWIITEEPDKMKQRRFSPALR